MFDLILLLMMLVILVVCCFWVVSLSLQDHSKRLDTLTQRLDALEKERAV